MVRSRAARTRTSRCSSLATDRLAQRARREGAVRMLRLPRVAELCDRAGLAERDEDRIEAEAFRTGSGERDLAAQHAGAHHLVPARRQRDELAHVLRAAIVDAVELRQDLLDVAALCPA